MRLHTVDISLALCLLLASCVFAPSLLADAEAADGQKTLLYLVKNDDALLKSREAALERLIEKPKDGLRDVLLSVLDRPAKSDSAKLFRLSLREALKKLDDPKLIQELESRVVQKKTEQPARERALVLLFDLAPDRALKLASGLVGRGSEPEGLRVTAFNAMALHETKDAFGNVAEKLARDVHESFKVRLTAINFLESRADLKQNKKALEIYEAILKNPAELPRLQSLLTGRAVLAGVSAYNGLFLEILRNRSFAQETRLAALGALTQPETGEQHLSSLRNIYTSERSSLKQELKASIEKIERRDKP